MKKEVFTFLKSCSTETYNVNRLIVSAFLYSNEIFEIGNSNLRCYFINVTDLDFHQLEAFLSIQKVTSLEDLIELFEFVISPEDRIINGAIYTPKNIREYIVDKTLDNFNNLENLIICDPACGCSGFLFTAAKKIKEATGRSYKEIFETNLFGLDIEAFSVERSQILLSLLAISEGEIFEEINFNIYEGNALSYDWSNVILGFEGFDAVIGNPPYVCSRNMDARSLDLIHNWEVSRSGHPDLYIPFFQLGIELLRDGGVLGYITVNTFLKSINGRALREYFAHRNLDLRIINFGGEQIFLNRNTYTCLCFVTNQVGSISYFKTGSALIRELEDGDFSRYEYGDLDGNDGWNLVNRIEDREFIDLIERTGTPFHKKYITRNGVATLKNHIYKFVPIDSTETTFILKTKSGDIYQIEKNICRGIVNSNKISREADLTSKREEIIFPYRNIEGAQVIIDEEDMIQNFPLAYHYLSDHKEELATRDKGKKDYEKWYAYGRRQSLDIYAFKLFFPHISERPSFVICDDQEMLFYNGIAVISENLEELQLAKIIMESDLFFRYIKSTTKDYSSGYISMSKNYIKNFGIPEFTEEEKRALLLSDDPQRILLDFYNNNRDRFGAFIAAEPHVHYGG